MTTNTENTLASRLDLGEVTSWRLHWLLCDLWNLQRDVKAASFGRGVADLLPFGELLERLKRIEGGYSRLQWETKTMLGMDYENEVQPLFEAIPKNSEYAATLGQVKTQLQSIVDKSLETERQRLHSSILQSPR